MRLEAGVNEALRFDADAYTLQSHEAVERWDEIAPLLAQIDLVEMPISEIREKVETCEAQVWCIGTPIECVLLTRVENTLGHRYGLLWMASGDLRLLEVARLIVEPWFKSLGCKYVQIIGRRGWKKHLPDYTERAINLVKVL